jgi:TRAP transporter TAXI family solute receptor
MDFGFMASNWIGRARQGEPPFATAIALRMAAPMNAGPLVFIARADSALRSVADLRGRRVAVGGQNSGMAQHARVILGALGMSLDDIAPAFLDFAAGAAALAAGDVDAQLQCPIPNKVMDALMQRAALRVLGYEAEQLQRVLERVPYYRRTQMRGLPRLAADLPQLAVVNVLVTHARTADASVRELVRAVIEGADELGRLNPLFADMRALFAPLRGDGAPALEFGGVPLHAGAREAYREAGLLR